MKRFINPSAINILGGMPEQSPKTDRGQTDRPTPEPSRWEKIKIKAKSTWKAFMEVARDIKDTIVPIVSAVGVFLTGLAAFRNKDRNYSQHRGRTAWAS